MAEKGELDELAQRYLDLWQDQMSALAADPEVAAAMERALHQGMPSAGAAPNADGSDGAAPQGQAGAAAMPAFAWAWPAAMMAAMQSVMQPGGASGPWAGWAPQGTGNGTNGSGAADAGGQQSGSPGTAPAGTAAAAGASGRGDLDVDQLLRRLAVLEERIAALEKPEPKTRSGGKSGKSKAGGRKRGSGS